MTFVDFIWFKGKPGIFFGVELGAVASVLVLLFIFRNERNPLVPIERTEVKDYFPSVLLVSMVLLLIAASFVPSTGVAFVDENMNGFIVMLLLLVGLVRKLIQTKSFRSLGATVKEIDYFTLLLLASLFLIIGSIKNAGVIDEIANLIKKAGGGNAFAVYTIIVWLSVLFSAFVDNIPYVATMLHVVASLASGLGLEAPYVLYFGLLTGRPLAETSPHRSERQHHRNRHSQERRVRCKTAYLHEIRRALHASCGIDWVPSSGSSGAYD